MADSSSDPRLALPSDAALDFLNSSVTDSTNDSGDNNDEDTEDPTGLPNPHSRTLQHLEMFLTPSAPSPRTLYPRVKHGGREPQPLSTFIPDMGTKGM